MLVKTKNKSKIKDDDSWLYILLLCTITILGEALKNYSFSIRNIQLSYTIMILPIMYFLANYITKKYNYQKGIAAICLSSVSFVLFTYAIYYALGRNVDLLSIGGELFGYFISQIINMYIYLFLLNNTKSPIILVFVNYMFAHIIFYMFYTLINLSVLITDSYWEGYFITLLIQLFECLALALVDSIIKRGLEKND